MSRNLDFYQFIEDTNSAKDSDEIFLCLQTALASLGFDQTLFSMMNDHDSIGKKAGHGVMRNYAEDWMKHYGQKNYADVDPVRVQVIITNQPFLWEKLEKTTNYGKGQKVMMNEAHDAGLKRGIGLGIHAQNNEIMGFGFASSDGTAETDPNTVSLVKALANQFHMAYIQNERRFGSHHSPKHITVTTQEKNILYYMSLSKTNSEISDIMKISEHTVDSYIRKLFKKFEAHNRMYCVIKAISLGVIVP